MQKLSEVQRETWGGSQQVRQLFIGGLPEKTCESTLNEYFSTFGYLTECRIVRDQLTQQSRGFAFVTFARPEDAQKALSWKKHLFLKKEISVKPADSKAETEKQNLEERARKIFIVNLAHHTKKEDLRKHFSQFGVIESIDLFTHKGYGFILFKQKLSVTNALEHPDDHMILGQKIEVRPVLNANERNQMKVAKLNTTEFLQQHDQHVSYSRDSNRGRSHHSRHSNKSRHSVHSQQQENDLRNSQGSPDRPIARGGIQRTSDPHNGNAPSLVDTRPRNSRQLGSLLMSLMGNSHQHGKGAELNPSPGFEEVFEEPPSQPEPVTRERNGTRFSNPLAKSTSGFSNKVRDYTEDDVQKHLSYFMDDEEKDVDQVKHPRSDGNYDLTSTQVSGFGLLDRSSLESKFRPFNTKVASMFTSVHDANRAAEKDDRELSLLGLSEIDSKHHPKAKPKDHKQNLGKSEFGPVSKSIQPGN